MRTDELRDALDALAGDAPEPQAPYARAVRRARSQRRRASMLVSAAAVCLAVVVAVAVVDARSGTRRVTTETPPPTGSVADLAWTRVAAPSITVTRIVTNGSQRFALGSTGAAAAIDTLDANGAAHSVFRGSVGGRDACRPAVNDLASVGGDLVAVGQDVAFANGEVGGFAWRSTDGGSSWRRVLVDQPKGVAESVPSGVTVPLTTIKRIVVADGVFYAFGSSWVAQRLPGGVVPVTCNPLVWTSTDGTHFRLAPIQSAGCHGLVDAANGPAGLLAVGSDAGGAGVWSNEAGTWAARLTTGLSGAGITALAGDTSGYVAVGSVGSRAAIWWSANGTTWTNVVKQAAPATAVQEAAIVGVVHTDLGWLAAGWQIHAGDGEPFTDALVWTSTDGQHWTPDRGDAGTFELLAYTGSVGVTPDGFALVGTANITGRGIAQDPVRQDNVLWFGSPAAPAPPGTGRIEGDMRIVGGPAPGINTLVDGTMVATDAHGRRFTATIGPGGRFSTQLPTGTYKVLGHNPGYGGGTYGCTTNGPVTVRVGTPAHVELICSIE